MVNTAWIYMFCFTLTLYFFTSDVGQPVKKGHQNIRNICARTM